MGQEGQVFHMPPLPSEQTSVQKALADPVIEEIILTGTSGKYGDKIVRIDTLAIAYLRQQASDEEREEYRSLMSWFDSTFGRYGCYQILDAYDFHPSRIEETRRIARETVAIMKSLPSMCRLPRNRPTSS